MAAPCLDLQLLTNKISFPVSFFNAILSKSVKRAKFAQNLDAEFNITQKRAKILNKPLASKRYTCRVLVDMPPSRLPCHNLQKTDRIFGVFFQGASDIATIRKGECWFSQRKKKALMGICSVKSSL